MPAQLKRPSVTGPGSGRDAWYAYALSLEHANVGLQVVIERQRDAIAALNAQADQPRPPAMRKRLPDDKTARIEAGIRAGQTTRQVAAACGVSAMTVSRIGKRMKISTPL